MSQVAGKGWGWYSSSGQTANDPTSDLLPPTPRASGSRNVPNIPDALDPLASSTSSSSSVTESSGYWKMAQGSIQNAAQHTIATVSNYMPNLPWSGGSFTGRISDTASDSSSVDAMIMENMPVTSSRRPSTSMSILTSPKVLSLFHNPYVTIRGGGRNLETQNPSSSMDAIRSFISVVPAPPIGSADCAASEVSSTNHGEFYSKSRYNPFSSTANTNINTTSPPTPTTLQSPSQQQQTPPPPLGLFERSVSTASQGVSRHTSPSETASHLAEGTLRAFRDIALDEAVELHQALRYWSNRWERPLLAWLEAGPSVWFSEQGYRHQHIGQKMSQIQAVLARRCATIGELQHHLLRAGWQRGVGQWGVLGDGGEWATVAGGDGRMNDTSTHATATGTTSTPTQNRSSSGTTTVPTLPPPSPLHHVSSATLDHVIPPTPNQQQELPSKAPASNVSQLPQQSRHDQLYYTSVLVKRSDDGKIVIDDPALAEWSVDAMALVRRQLYRAANGLIILPYAENWAEGDDQSRLSLDIAGSMTFEDHAPTEEVVPARHLPLWASQQRTLKQALSQEIDPGETDEGETIVPTKPQDEGDATAPITISDLPLLVNEVSDLLNVMEAVIKIQRERRLEKLKPHRWLRRNWYVGLAIPPFLYLSYKAAARGYGWSLLRYTATKLSSFFTEHVVDPFLAMYDEFTKGTENISDREARSVVIKNLQKMILSWLEETHPEMSKKERKRMATAMDISLIEAAKEEDMKKIYNINSVIRMSFIEAQFLKKVRNTFHKPYNDLCCDAQGIHLTHHIPKIVPI